MKPTSIAVLALWMGVAPAVAGARLVLTDGRVLSGSALRLDGTLYLLEQPSGHVIPLPVDVVLEGQFAEHGPTTEVEDADDPDVERRVDPLTGITYDRKARTLAGDETPASGLIEASPLQLDGDPARAPRTSEQLAVFDEPGRFPRSVIDPHYVPSGDWDFSDPAGNNSWSPARWARSPIASEFVPTSDWQLDPRQNNSWAASDWAGDPGKSRWTPRDGFRNQTAR